MVSSEALLYATISGPACVMSQRAWKPPCASYAVSFYTGGESGYCVTMGTILHHSQCSVQTGRWENPSPSNCHLKSFPPFSPHWSVFQVIILELFQRSIRQTIYYSIIQYLQSEIGHFSKKLQMVKINPVNTGFILSLPKPKDLSSRNGSSWFNYMMLFVSIQRTKCRWIHSGAAVQRDTSISAKRWVT